MIGAIEGGSDPHNGRVFVRCTVTSSPLSVWNPPLLPKSRLRQGPLVPFTAEGLRTGDCLVRLGCGQRTFHITFEQYERLRTKLPPVGVSARKKAKVSEDLLVAENADEFADYPRAHRPDILSDRTWTVSCDEPFNSAEWKIIPWERMPLQPQPPPPSLEWDACVVNPPAVSPNEWYDYTRRAPDISRIARKSAAKTEAGKARYWKKKSAECEARKKLFRYYNDLIGREQSVSADEGNEIILRCSRCGGSIFPDEKHCLDCGKYMGRSILQKSSCEKEWGHAEEDYIASEKFKNKHSATPHKGHGRRKKIAYETVARLLAATAKSKLWDLDDIEKLRKAANTARILAVQDDGSAPIAKDVAEETGEALRAIEQRCETIMKAARACAEQGKEPPPIPLTTLLLLAKFYPDEGGKWTWKVLGSAPL